MSIGGAVSPADLGALPGSIEVHQSVPQLEVLRHARLFVTHAGMGSVMEALHAGVPMVAVPQMAEQRANADRLVQLGLGRQPHPDLVTAAAVREAVDAVVNDADVRACVGQRALPGSLNATLSDHSLFAFICRRARTARSATTS